MATLRGEQGAVQFETGGGSLATVVGTRSWSITIDKETYEVTKHGDTFRNYVGGLISGSGTVELIYDPDATGQAGLIEDIVKANDAADASFELFTTGTSAGTDSLSFGAIITNMEISATVGELNVASCNFQTCGTITSNLQ
ncbi:MAG: hypothetical protein Unbinned1819contig1001_13 [Prokaryotic dsDNA virus sp.]|nr:MAG: hypothetical protein Unbinned1819contig1001_13 [Prokaryotic dsDNA virus sp.]|tara:strand:+ start:831 stop:1253 length:423 start_codon:yes stop_codon:yes gene_type:complete